MKSTMREQRELCASRRDFLFNSAYGFGGIALSTLLGAEARANAPAQAANLLAPKQPHLPAKAKACIFLLMDGGPSHIDTFDPKPKLRQLHMQEFVRERNRRVSAMESGKRYYMASPFNFIRARNGMGICEHFSNLSELVDDICFYRGAQAESVNHPTALYHFNTGNQFGADPAVGAWVSYGLGTLNQNLPTFVVLPDVIWPQGGAPNWSNGFLSPQFQGTPLRASGAPILDMTPPSWVTRAEQRRNLDLLAELNREHERRHPTQSDLRARIEAYELAFRMQVEIPEIVSIDKEPEATKRLWFAKSPSALHFQRLHQAARRSYR